MASLKNILEIFLVYALSRTLVALFFFQNYSKCSTAVIRQKGESQTGVLRKQSTSNFPKNEHFLPSDMYTYVCVSGGKKCSLFGKFGVLYFLKTRFDIRPFALLAMKSYKSYKSEKS